MSDKMPREIWLQAPIDTPEIEWKGNGDITWCWHPVNGNDDPDTKYLRVDTCTPNEKLEELIADIEKVVSDAGKGDYGDGVRTMGKLAIRELREVMK